MRYTEERDERDEESTKTNRFHKATSNEQEMVESKKFNIDMDENKRCEQRKSKELSNLGHTSAEGQ